MTWSCSDVCLFYPETNTIRQTLENQLRAELNNDIPMKDLGVVMKVPIQWDE